MESVAFLYDRLLDQLLLPPLVKRMEYVLSDAMRVRTVKPPMTPCMFICC